MYIDLRIRIATDTLLALCISRLSAAGASAEAILQVSSLRPRTRQVGGRILVTSLAMSTYPSHCALKQSRCCDPCPGSSTIHARRPAGLR